MVLSDDGNSLQQGICHSMTDHSLPVPARISERNGRYGQIYFFSAASLVNKLNYT